MLRNSVIEHQWPPSYLILQAWLCSHMLLSLDFGGLVCVGKESLASTQKSHCVAETLMTFLLLVMSCHLVTPGDTSMEDDPSELSNQITAPGILKIFGSEICQGAHYKSVLATTHSSARELVKEALER